MRVVSRLPSIGHSNWFREKVRTWLSNADPNSTALKSRARVGKRFFKTFDRGEFDVAETLGATIKLVLNNAYIGHFAVGKQLRDVTGCGVKGKIADMSSERRLGGKRKFGARREGGTLAVFFDSHKSQNNPSDRCESGEFYR